MCWIWPAVWWILRDGDCAGALVHLGLAEMSWSRNLLLTAGDGAAASPAFWRELDRIRVVSAWSDREVPTFPAGWTSIAPGPRLEELTMRSLWPVTGIPSTSTEVSARRAIWEPALRARVPQPHVEALVRLCARS